jgi:ArsR family transcriptional regulator
MDNDETLNTLRALSQDSRWDIVQFLSSHAESCPKEISNHIGIPPSTLSFHLKQLTEAEILEARNSGRETFYRVKPGQLEKIVERLQDLAEGTNRTL